jgi:hypothetical protein
MAFEAPCWAHVRSLLDQLLQSPSPTKTWTDLYNVLFQVYIADGKEAEKRQLYAHFVLLFEAQCWEHRSALAAAPSTALLALYCRHRLRYLDLAKVVRKVTAYMHRYYTQEHCLPDLYLTAIATWDRLVWPHFASALFQGFLSLAQARQQERTANGDALLQSLINSFAEVRLIETAAHLGPAAAEQALAAGPPGATSLVELHARRMLQEIEAIPAYLPQADQQAHLQAALSRVPDDELLRRLQAGAAQAPS